MEDVMQHVNHFNDEFNAIYPPVNIRETNDGFELHLVVAGLKKEDFKISADRNMLHVSHEQPAENKDQQPEGKWLRNEYRVRSFKRSFTLSDKVDTSKISAKYADGILMVSLPKKEAAEPSAHEISVN